MATLSGVPAYWGPIVTNKDYELVLEGTSYYDNLVLLDGHSLGSPDVDQRDPVSVERTYRENGILIQRMEYVKPALVRSRSYEIGIPRGSFWSPVVALTQNEGRACFRNVFMRYLCPSQPCYAHSFRYPNAIFDPIVEQDTLIATEDDEEGINSTTTLHTAKRMIYYYLQLHEQADKGATVPPPNYKSVKFAMGDCPNCDENPHAVGYVVGDDGDTPAVPVILYSEDRFALAASTTTDQSANIPAAANATTLEDVYANGDFAIFIGNDATNSEIFVTNDHGDTISLARNASTGAVSFANVIFTKVKAGLGYYWVVGDNQIWRSQDGYNWTQLSVPAAWATYNFNDVAFDEKTGLGYIVGDNGGNAFVARISGDTVSDISASVLGGVVAQVLHSVAVLEQDHVAIGGTNGTYYEQDGASLNMPWRAVALGTTQVVNYIGGDSYRTVAATAPATPTSAAGNVYERGILTDMRFTPIDIAAGFTLTDGFVAGDAGKSHMGVNDFVFVTPTETFIAKSCVPGA